MVGPRRTSFLGHQDHLKMDRKCLPMAKDRQDCLKLAMTKATTKMMIKRAIKPKAKTL